MTILAPYPGTSEVIRRADRLVDPEALPLTGGGQFRPTRVLFHIRCGFLALTGSVIWRMVDDPDFGFVCPSGCHSGRILR
jgi:hypothetical protein